MDALIAAAALAAELNLDADVEVFGGVRSARMFAAGPVVLRVQPVSVTDLVAARFAAAQRLSSAGVALEQGVAARVVGEFVVTAWQRVDDSAELDWEEAGAVFADLHRAPVQLVGGSPWALDQRLVATVAEGAAERGVISATRAEQLVGRVLAAEPLLGAAPVPVHGDAWPKNLLAGVSPVLCDLDTLACGAAVHDLALVVAAAHYPAREVLGRHPVPNLDAFSSGYGAALPAPSEAQVVVRAHSAALAVHLAGAHVLAADGEAGTVAASRTPTVADPEEK